MQSFLINPEAQGTTTERRKAVLQALMQKQPQNVGEGIASLGAGLMAGYDKANAGYPAAPGGAKPSLLSGLSNIFAKRNTGGLF